MPDIYLDISKYEQVLPVNVSNTDATNDTVVRKKSNENAELQLSLCTEELIDGQNNDTFCSTISKLLSDKRMPPHKYFISDISLLHKVVGEDDKLFYALVVPLTLSKYILHQTYNILGHSGTDCSYCSGDTQQGANVLRLITEVKQSRARLIHGWVTVLLALIHSVIGD